ncbi:aromatic-ring-hydroxylating dioxygenase subunit beta [Alcaligenes nematophilus]|uniref:aromatic-ring-hydroxylating dioxygenase subunit beta n=1 Tax=Alcaligenes TaxID=507 RepID=UPI0019319A5B|nr:aromatic-ring-hydroxylating dioxygenase subunit beta [Alcaligenes faecalis]
MMGTVQEQGQRSGRGEHAWQDGQQQQYQHKAQQPLNPQQNQRLGQMESLKQSLQDFVWQENALLDEGRFDEWYELFAQDGLYWIPGESGQESPEGRMCIALENRMLMRLRIDRLSHHRAFSLQPGVRGLRVIQHPRVQSEHPDEDGCYTVRINLIYSEYQKQKTEVLPATASYRLRAVDQAWEIVEKRVDLLSVDGYLPTIQLFI